MPPSLEELGLLRLSPEDRFAVAQALWEYVEDEAAAAPLSDELKAELERRCAESDADPDGGVPWEEVQAKLMARYKS